MKSNGSVSGFFIRHLLQRVLMHGSTRFRCFLLAIILTGGGLAHAQKVDAKWRFNWSQLAPVPNAQGFAGSFAGISEGALIVAGGAQFRDGIRPWNGGVKIWDDRIWFLPEPFGQWKTGGRLPRPLGYGISLTTDEGLLCIGGSDSVDHHSDVFMLKLLVDTVVQKKLPPLPVALANACGAIVGRTVFVAGGLWSPQDTCRSECWSLDLDDLLAGWIRQPPIPGGGRMLAMAGSMDGHFYVFGGVRLVRKDSSGSLRRTYLRDAWVLDIDRGWHRLADLPWNLAAAPSPAFDPGHSHLFLFGGDDGRLADSTPILRDTHPGFRNEILAYASKTDQWQVVGRMPINRQPDVVTNPSLSTFAPVTTPSVVWNGRLILPGGEARPAVRTPRVLKAMPVWKKGKK